MLAAIDFLSFAMSIGLGSCRYQDGSIPGQFHLAEAIAGPKSDPGSADDVFDRQKTPATRIKAVVAVVAHDEDRPGGDGEGGQFVGGGFGDVGFAQGLAVDDDLVVMDFEAIAGFADDPFDEDLLFLVAPRLEDLRGLKDDDVAAMGGSRSEGDFFDDQPIVDEEGRHHRVRGNEARLGDEGANPQGDDDRDDEDDQVFALGFPEGGWIDRRLGILGHRSQFEGGCSSLASLEHRGMAGESGR
jgi:hypothetical protein